MYDTLFTLNDCDPELAQALEHEESRGRRITLS